MKKRETKKTTPKNDKKNGNPLKGVSISYQNSNEPIAENADGIIFYDHVNGIYYVGTCSEGITAIAIQNNNFINILKTFCRDVILFKPLPLFNVNYIDEETGKEISFIVKHINDSGIHIFYTCTTDEPDFLDEIQD